MGQAGLSGEAAGAVPQKEAKMSIEQFIDNEVKSNDVVLFMKGTPQFPQCGFSATAVQILKACGVTDFFSVNVLENPEIRNGIKDFAHWPPIPPLYVKGEFVGAVDIMKEWYQDGELQKTREGIARA